MPYGPGAFTYSAPWPGMLSAHIGSSPARCSARIEQSKKGPKQAWRRPVEFGCHRVPSNIHPARRVRPGPELIWQVWAWSRYISVYTGRNMQNAHRRKPKFGESQSDAESNRTQTSTQSNYIPCEMISAICHTRATCIWLCHQPHRCSKTALSKNSQSSRQS